MTEALVISGSARFGLKTNWKSLFRISYWFRDIYIYRCIILYKGLVWVWAAVLCHCLLMNLCFTWGLCADTVTKTRLCELITFSKAGVPYLFIHCIKAFSVISQPFFSSPFLFSFLHIFHGPYEKLLTETVPVWSTGCLKENYSKQYCWAASMIKDCNNTAVHLLLWRNCVSGCQQFAIQISDL